MNMICDTTSYKLKYPPHTPDDGSLDRNAKRPPLPYRRLVRPRALHQSLFAFNTFFLAASMYENSIGKPGTYPRKNMIITDGK